jgi:PKHD-type hydroxylase
MPDVNGKEESYAWWDNGFSDEEIQKIIAYGDELIAKEGKDATVAAGDVVTEIRRSKVAWISNSDETQWLYDRLAFITRMINAQFFDFDLYGFSEDFQYTVYHDTDHGHYNWHVDRGVLSPGSVPRKLSLVILLTDDTEYEGGDLELQYGAGLAPTKVDKVKGRVHAFPSWVLHRVTPVTKGIRKSLVVWTTGPKFK